ncbi:MAG: type II toxin-antitoxin system ParD family antitoxin [Candidatus Omnitrophota bacterium]|jgi:antitoxin ParD1/3/4|nr:MAG: type II toxin-antitoxin system ParD family antitoxin [Candidatus Omnitrophota bacterium]
MHVSLTDRLEEFVREKINSGFYKNASEVISEALRLMEQNDRLHQIKLDRLRKAVRIGDVQYARGEFSTRTIDDIIADNEAAVKRDC